MKKALSLLLSLALLLAALPAPAMAQGQTFTLMIYLCGTDLESQGGAATADLREMLRAGVPEKSGLTVYIQTGGTKSWQARGLTGRKAERWQLTADGLLRVGDAFQADMGKQATLADFLNDGLKRYPADRYGLILWDHGSGVMDGVCLDEMSQDSLDMSEIYGALTSAQKSLNGQKLAFVGFDACLMATYEMARHLEPFADYLIASEELEPGGGWAYDGWLGQLGKTPGMSVEKLGKQIVDSFITGTVQNDYTDYATLSVVDLSKLGGVQKALESMGESLQSKIDGGEFGTVSRIRRGLRSFGEISSSISTDMIDAGVFASAYQKQDASGAKALRSALKDAVVYSAHTNNLTDLSGLSVFVPYSTKNAAHTYLPAYDSQGLYPRYAGFVSQMLSKLTGQSFFFDMPAIGQTDAQQAQIDWFSQFADDPQTYQAAAEQAAQSPDDFSLDSFLGSLFGAGGTADVDESYTQEYNQPEAVTSANYETYAQTQTQAAIAIETAQNQQLVFQNPFAQVKTDTVYQAKLTDEQIKYLAGAEANLVLDVSDETGDYYVDLGFSQSVSVDWKNGAVYGYFDGRWPHLDGQMVCMYDQIANENYVRSLIPIRLNGVDEYLLVTFDKKSPKGKVIGATEGYTASGQPVRGYTKLKSGDVVTPMYQLLYWDEEGNECFEPFEGDPIMVEDDLKIAFSFRKVETKNNYRYGFCLQDIFGDYQYTQMAEIRY